jgi:alkanesulfonate monooxygenase SsuD/methylene tetrahydromethanopterin reductase-like flavin-dependent oxidoreductase (luciferase family)
MSQDSRKVRFGLWYDFRNPLQWRQSSDRLNREILEQIVWGEHHGFDDVWLSEHHFIDDEYLSAILPIAAAIAARTIRIRIASGVLLLPFHHPVRLAEDIAVVDVLSGGRLELGVGVGYKVEEFDSFGVPFTERGARTNDALGIVRRLLEGETVTCKNQFFDLNQVKITPEPIQKPHPPIWVGGFTPAALRRAVRYGNGFTVPDATRDVYERYIAALTKAHWPIENVRFASGFQWLLVSHDPEKTFHEAADHILYQADNYTAWLSQAGLMPHPVYLRDREQLRQSG